MHREVGPLLQSAHWSGSEFAALVGGERLEEYLWVEEDGN